MAHIERTELIGVSADKIYAYIADPTTTPEWWASVIEVRNLVGEVGREGLSYDWTYKMLGMKFDGKSTMTTLIPGEKIVVENEGKVSSTIEHSLAKEGNDTRYTMVIDYTVSGGFLDKLADKLFVERHNEREADFVVASVKAICEARAAAAAT
ncbi:MAG: SRPBCC family protein [Planctomycetota bacterium]|jgi:carbon monoxide dehydrogenase subunit G